MPIDNEARTTAFAKTRSNTRTCAVWLCGVTLVLLTTSLYYVTIVKGRLGSSAYRTRLPCLNPSLRQEWRTLPLATRQSYIAAVQCLTVKRSKLGLNASRYDDFVSAHLAVFNMAHTVAASLPWHRWYIHLYEDALVNECGYDGVLAYWDWTLDASGMIDSPIWSVSSGFGGNGSDPDGCVKDGPFKNMTPQFPEPHCLKRQFVPRNIDARNYTIDIIEDIVSTAQTYHDFRDSLENGPHKWLHKGIGGDMPTPSSVNDPLFFVHHAQIDRLWWKWQILNRDSRLQDYDSIERDLGNGTFGKLSVSLQDPLLMGGLGKDVEVKDVMSIGTDLLCYKYPSV